MAPVQMTLVCLCPRITLFISTWRDMYVLNIMENKIWPLAFIKLRSRKASRLKLFLQFLSTGFRMVDSDHRRFHKILFGVVDFVGVSTRTHKMPVITQILIGSLIPKANKIFLVILHLDFLDIKLLLSPIRLIFQYFISYPWIMLS